MNDQPYPGLRPFTREETDIFFGRDIQTAQLLDKLAQSRFVAVLGPSGYGKSSLVRTGLLAGLEAGLLSKTGSHWRIADMRPGHQPFTRLSEALLAEEVLRKEYTARLELSDRAVAGEALPLLHEALEQRLRQGPFSIHEIWKSLAIPAGARLLLLVDQFEEIFRYYRQGSRDDAAAFVELVLAATQHPDIYAIITMRSDFLGECAVFYELPEAINRGLFLVPRLNRDQLREAIEEPPEVFGGALETTLVNRLLNDVGHQVDQLPVLQHALMRLWHKDVEPDAAILLTVADYEKIGGLTHALSLHADEAYNELDEGQQRIAELMFRSLCERSGEGQVTRRPVELSEVATLAEVPWQEVAVVAEVFRQPGRSFLTPPPSASSPNETIDYFHLQEKEIKKNFHDDLTPGTVLAMSHESLTQLNEKQLQTAEIIFRALRKQRSSGHRPVKLVEVATAAGVSWEEAAVVVEVFRQPGRSFLTPPPSSSQNGTIEDSPLSQGKAKRNFHDYLAPGTILDISHESLIRQWQRLNEWMEDETGSAKLYQRLDDSARRWEKGEAALWRAPDLEYAMAWRAKRQPNAIWAARYGGNFDLAMRFLDASKHAQQREMAEQRRRGRMSKGGFTFVALLAIGLTFWLISEKAIEIGEDSLNAQAQDHITSIRDSKKAEIETYFELVTNQIEYFSKVPTNVEMMLKFKQAFYTFDAEAAPPEALPVEEYKTALEDYYTEEFPEEYETLNPDTAPNMARKLEALNDNSTALQYHYIAANGNPLGTKEELVAARDPSGYTQLHRDYHPSILDYMNRFGFEDILFVDPDTGYIIYSVLKEVDFATSLTNGPYAQSGVAQIYAKTVAAGRISLIDFAPYLPSYMNQAAFMGAPVYMGNKLIGVFIFRLPIHKINDIMTYDRSWRIDESGKTGETFIIAADGTMRNDSRALVENKENYIDAVMKTGLINANTIMKIELKDTTVGLQKLDNTGVRAAFSGVVGFDVLPDYRGIDVLSAFSPINVPGLQWVIFSTLQEDEALEKLKDLSNGITEATKPIALTPLLLYLLYLAWSYLQALFRDQGKNTSQH